MTEAATAAPHPCTVLYVNIFGLPLFREILESRPGVRLVGLRDDAPRAAADPVLAETLVYQVSSSRLDIRSEYWIDDAFLARAPRLLMASAIGAGYDPVDVDACTLAGVLVVNQAGGGNAESVAEHMLGMLLALTKRVGEADRAMRRSAGIVRSHFLGRNALGKTVGIIGYGHVGRRLARMCQAALSMRVLVHTTQDLAGAAGPAVEQVERVELDALLRTADYVLVCCALNDRTRGMLDARAFALMQPHAYFITAARGGIHDEQALHAALVEKRIAGAGIDVWDVEPPPPDHPLLQLDNVIATPHTGGATHESRIQASSEGARRIHAVLEGRRPDGLLNPQAWPRFAERFAREFGFQPSGLPMESAPAQSAQHAQPAQPAQSAQPAQPVS